MNVSFADSALDRLETDASFTGGQPASIVKRYRKLIQLIRAAKDERDLREMKSSRFEKLKGKRQNQHSMRINDQYRLVLEITDTGGRKTVHIVAIEDYH